MFEMLVCLVAILKTEELHSSGKLRSRDFLINCPYLFSSTCCLGPWPLTRPQKMKDSVSQQHDILEPEVETVAVVEGAGGVVP